MVAKRSTPSPVPKVFKGVYKVCKGDITEKITREFDATTGPPIIGGFHNQFHDVHDGYYCLGCGIRYEFIPDIPETKPT